MDRSGKNPNNAVFGNFDCSVYKLHLLCLLGTEKDALAKKSVSKVKHIAIDL